MRPVVRWAEAASSSWEVFDMDVLLARAATEPGEDVTTVGEGLVGFDVACWMTLGSLELNTPSNSDTPTTHPLPRTLKNFNDLASIRPTGLCVAAGVGEPSGGVGGKAVRRNAVAAAFAADAVPGAIVRRRARAAAADEGSLVPSVGVSGCSPAAGF